MSVSRRRIWQGAVYGKPENQRRFTHIQAIANTAGFHMPTIEQGGNSLYPSMAQRANSVEVLQTNLIMPEPSQS